jgi:hypothetical protein
VRAPQERNESLFHYVLANNIEELLPIVHMPTVSLYCQKYGLMFKSLPRSLYISIKDKGAQPLFSQHQAVVIVEADSHALGTDMLSSLFG